MLKLIFLIILVYYAVRTLRNLVRAVRTDGAPPPRMQPPPHRGGPASGVRGPWQNTAAPRRRPDVQIEDAEWEDIS